MGMHKQEYQLQGTQNSLFHSTQHRKALAVVQSWALSTTLKDQCELTWEERLELKKHDLLGRTEYTSLI